MAVRLDLPRQLVETLATTKIESLERAMRKASNDIIKKALAEEIRAIETAISKITEIR